MNSENLSEEIQESNQKTALLLKIEYGTVIKRTNQKTALLLKKRK